MTAYNEFAFIYDDLMKRDFDYEKWFEYIEEIFKERKVEVNSILEMGCGTGNLSKEIGNKGYDLTIFDLSPEMLSIADGKLNEFKNIKLFRQDMINFKFDKKYDSIVSVCDSINYILKYDDLVQVFKNVYEHLEDNGIFIFDINSYYKIKNILGNNIFIDENEKVYYTWENFFDEETSICEFFLNFFVTKDGENYRRFTEQHFERAYKEQEIEKALLEVGFKDMEKYECFTFDQVKVDTERINYIVRK